MCDLRSNSASTHFLGTPLGKKDQEFKMPGEQDNSGTGDLTSASNKNNIIHLTTIDQLLENLRKDLGDKEYCQCGGYSSRGCAFKQRSSTVATQYKPINISTYTYETPNSSSSKVTPCVSESSAVITLDGESIDG